MFYCTIPLTVRRGVTGTRCQNFDANIAADGKDELTSELWFVFAQKDFGYLVGHNSMIANQLCHVHGGCFTTWPCTCQLNVAIYYDGDKMISMLDIRQQSKSVNGV